ncbi:unnamed protein product [Medioppia subpectinata]|uniref:C2H2-type domain-containing protein n=1 Tax=Medioppia subpectinata TaxID=1979941 RepID=A0A7R9KEU1_9ACAR|nr:unnamed protein product [Medioppia subpectinata]CAG2101875.1 unnamed protein product [Medioppia subpectinata]
MNRMDKSTESNASEPVFHDLQPSPPIEDTPQVKEEEVDGTGLQELSHFWWCPYFAHNSQCPYIANTGSAVANSWPQKSVQSERKPYKSRTTGAAKSVTNGSTDCKIERLYSCRLCNGVPETNDETSFRKHIELHLGKERPFVCQICDKLFNFRSNCRNHVMAHCVVRKQYHP